jgi:hypothetical protein
MAGTQITQSSQFAQTIYRDGVIIEAMRSRLAQLSYGPEKEGYAIAVLDKKGMGRGSTAKIRFTRPRAVSAITPHLRGGQIEGNEANVEYLEDDITTQYWSLSHALESEITDQDNVSFDLRENEQTMLAREWADARETQFMNQASGYTPANDATSDYFLTGGQVAREPDTAHWFYAQNAAGTTTTEAGVVTDQCVLTSTLFDDISWRLRSKSVVKWPFVPAKTPWGRKLICLLFGSGMNQMRANSPDNNLFELSMAEIKGGMDSDISMVVTGDGFVYGPWLFIESDYCTLGTDGTADATTTANSRANCRRGVIMGERALHCMWGESFVDGDHWGYTEFIKHRRLSMQMDTVMGIKAVRVDSQRYASAVVSHYSPV